MPVSASAPYARPGSAPAIAAGLTESDWPVRGLLAPHAWLSLFDTDPAMLDAGTRYLQAVGPFYGLFGLGMALYFASQGAGRLLWPLLANLVRLLIAAGGGWLALRWGGDLSHVFLALGRGACGLRSDQRGSRRRRRLVQRCRHPRRGGALQLCPWGVLK